MKIRYIYDWGKTEKSLAWSGTPYSLMTSLQKFTDTIDVELHVSEEIRNQIKKRENLLDKLHNPNFRRYEIKIVSKLLNQYLTNISDRDVIIQYLEYMTKYVSSTYTYQDLSVDFLYRMRIEHNSLEKYTPLGAWIRTREVKKRKKEADKLYNKCAGIFTMSQWLAKDLIENTGVAPDKVHSVGGGCNIDVSSIDHSKKKGTRFLFVGKDFERKNGKLVCDAFRIFSEKHPEAELYIIGPNTCPEIEMCPNIHFEGRKTYQELIHYYNMCDYFVMPSKFEAYGLVFAEALCFGLPCIGANRFAMPEFIQDGQNGFLLNDIESANELSVLMEKLYITEKISQYVMEHQGYYCEKYSWDAVAKRMLKVINR